MRPYKQAGVAVESMNNRLKIEFDGTCTVVITMHTPGIKRETLIFVNLLRAKVSQKYVIEGAVLREDTTPNSTESGNLSAPNADNYVTIVAEKLAQSLAILQLNERRYYLQWRDNIEDGVSRQALYMPKTETQDLASVTQTDRQAESRSKCEMANDVQVVEETAEIDEMGFAHTHINQSGEEKPTGDLVDIEARESALIDSEPDMIIERETLIFPGEESQGDRR